MNYVGKLFQVGVRFSTGNAKETALSEVSPENVKAILEIVQFFWIENKHCKIAKLL